MAKSLTDQATEAFLSGADVAEAVDTRQTEAGEASEETASFAPEAKEVEEEKQAKGEEPAEEVQEDAPSAIDKKVKSGSKEPTTEVLEVAGRKFTIDWANKESVRSTLRKVRDYELGMRKFQTERDASRKELEAAKKERDEIKTNWSKLDGIFQSEGVEGLVKQLTGGKKTMDDFVNEKIAREKLRVDNPLEASRLDWEEKLAAERREREKLAKRASELESTMAARTEKAELAELNAQVTPMFDRARFAGRLGNPAAEARLDRALWRDGLEALEDLAKKGEEVTPATILSTFKTIASEMQGVIRQQVEKQSTAATAARQRSAKENAQVAVKTKTAGGATDEFTKKYKSGDIAGALVDVLAGKVKLR